MNPNPALARLIVAAHDIAALENKELQLEKKLLAPVIYLLRECDLNGVRRLAREHRDAVVHAIERMSRVDLKTCLNRWNKHREKLPKEFFTQDVILELIALVTGAQEPAPKPAPAKKQPKKATNSRSARPRVAAE